MESQKTLTYTKDGVTYTIDSDGKVLQSFQDGVTTKYFDTYKETYYPHLRLMDRYKFDRFGNYTLDYTLFYDISCVGLKVWYDALQTPSSFAIGEIVTNSEYSTMHFSSRKPILSTFTHKVAKFIAYWRNGQFYDVSLLVAKITPQDKTTQQTLSEKIVKNLPVL